MAAAEALAQLEHRKNVAQNVVQRLRGGESSVDVEVIVKGFAVNPWFYRPVIDDTPAMRQRGMVRVAESLPPGLASRLLQGAQLERGRARGRFGASDIEVISRSGHVHAIAVVADRYLQAADMQALGDTVKTAPLNSQGITGIGQRVALIDTRFYPQSLGAALVQEECFCASGCCPGGLTRRSGSGSSLTTGTVSGPDHGTQTASVIAYAGNQGLARSAGIVGIAAPSPQDVFTALDWLATRSDIGVVSLSIGESVSTGVRCPLL